MRSEAKSRLKQAKSPISNKSGLYIETMTQHFKVTNLKKTSGLHTGKVLKRSPNLMNGISTKTSTTAKSPGMKTFREAFDKAKPLRTLCLNTQLDSSKMFVPIFA